jgi:hypothetical protein
MHLDKAEMYRQVFFWSLILMAFFSHPIFILKIADVLSLKPVPFHPHVQKTSRIHSCILASKDVHDSLFDRMLEWTRAASGRHATTSALRPRRRLRASPPAPPLAAPAGRARYRPQGQCGSRPGLPGHESLGSLLLVAEPAAPARMGTGSDLPHPPLRATPGSVKPGRRDGPTRGPWPPHRSGTGAVW